MIISESLAMIMVRLVTNFGLKLTLLAIGFVGMAIVGAALRVTMATLLREEYRAIVFHIQSVIVYVLLAHALVLSRIITVIVLMIDVFAEIVVFMSLRWLYTAFMSLRKLYAYVFIAHKMVLLQFTASRFFAIAIFLRLTWNRTDVLLIVAICLLLFCIGSALLLPLHQETMTMTVNFIHGPNLT